MGLAQRPPSSGNAAGDTAGNAAGDTAGNAAGVVSGPGAGGDRWRVIATAGHVDHGKSTLVRALTGVDPDRWAEEKARGLTIDLGFAAGTLPSGRRYSIVDVPGHVRFLKNMLAGVGAVDVCLFVVDAAEGWMPQSEEHLRILEVLGIRHGVVALTKVDRLDAGALDEVRAAVAARLAGSFLAGAPLVAVDSLGGTGLDELVGALDDVLATAPSPADAGRPRLWVDRSFAARGAGTVVTGTLTGGPLAVGDRLVVGPARLPVRVRGLQVHGAAAERVLPGSRVAVNLAGVDHDRVARGDALVEGDRWHHTTVADASLSVLGALDHPLTRTGAYLAYLGSGEHPARLRVLGGGAIDPGGHGHVRLRWSNPLPLLPGDRYVLRESGRGETVGGGEVLDVDPVRTAATAHPDRRIERVVAERGWITVDDLERRTGRRVPPTVGRWVVSPDALADLEAKVRDAVDAAGDLGLDPADLDERGRAVVERSADLEVVDGRVRPAGADDPLADHPWVRALAAAPFQPPPPEGVEPAALRTLVQRGVVVEGDGVHFAAAAVNEAARLVAGMLADQPAGVTVAEVRAALGTTRKWAVPLMGILDRSGITRRRGDVRVAGPRLPAPGP